MDNKNDKITRILDIYTNLTNGYLINKAEMAQKYEVNERSIQRDIDDIRDYLDNSSIKEGIINSVRYDRTQKGYRLEQIYKMNLTNSEILAVCKILLASRAFTKAEMVEILNKLVSCCVPEANQKLVNELISNEVFHYVALQHNMVLMDNIWEIGQAIGSYHYIEIDYESTEDKAIVTRKVKPVALLFSEYYFYLTAFDNEEVRQMNNTQPTIYCLDRIKKLKVLKESFYIPYGNRFEEGEFRKRIQLMHDDKK